MQDEQRPLFTIAVLVSGVVGGLAVVITAVYLYRFCLKKRPPVTTTCKPEQKREQIRSEQPSQCRPLPLLLEDHSREQTVDTVVERESGCFGSPTKIAQVFPLMPKDIPYVQRSLIQSHQDIAQNTIYQATNQSRASSFLAVGDLPLRAHSAELLSVNDSQEIRRSSCDVPRGTGRQLPSTEGLEKKQLEDRHRRMSTFARSDAVHIPGYMPRKQNSTPCPPTAHRIYDRSHAYSRSWNPECSSPPTHSSQQSAHFSSYHYNRPDDFQYNITTDRYPSRTSYDAGAQGVDQYSPDTCYETSEQSYPQALFIPTINEPEQQTSALNVRPFQRQAKSFDDRARVADSRRPSMADRRTVSVTEARNQFSRQATIQQQHTGDESPVTKACHSLWAAKGHLEQLHALGISDPSSASTSFDSNTDSQSIAMDQPKPKQEENADRKRMKYNSNRKSSEQSVCKHQALDRRRSFRASCKRASAFTQDTTQKRRSHSKIEYDNVKAKDRRSSYCPPPTIRCNGQPLHYNQTMRCDNMHKHPPSSSSRTARRYSMMPMPSDDQRRDNYNELSRKQLSHDHVDYRYRKMSQIIPQTAENDQHFSKSMDYAYRRDSFDYQNHRPSNRRMSDLHWNQRLENNLSLLIQRKFLSTTAVSSMDSTNSTESSAHDPLFTSSVDSLKSDLEQRRLSLMTRHCNVSSPHIARPSRLERDYSVDTKSDNLFREWSRVDPAYAARDHRDYSSPIVVTTSTTTPMRLQRGSTQDPYNQPQRERMYGRQMTIAGGSSHVVPFICYPDEQNCSR